MTKGINTRSIALLLLFLLLLSLIIIGCSKEGRTPPPQVNLTPVKRPVKAAVLADRSGGYDDGVNISAWKGLQAVSKDSGIEVKLMESKKGNYAIGLRRLVERGYNLIFAVGAPMQDAVAEVAPKYPKTRFVVIDGDAPDAKNVCSVKFREEEGGYLIGVLAAGVSRTSKVGFIGGVDMPFTKRYECGYRAGAATSRPGISVVTEYTTKWNDSDKGKELALAQFGDGAGVVFHVSGGCGSGVINAAKAKGDGYLTVGVDPDQDKESSAPALTCMVKRVDYVVGEICNDAVAGTFQPGDREYGFKEGGIVLTRLSREVQPSVAGRVGRLQSLILAGGFHPPKTEKELQTFKPPKL